MILLGYCLYSHINKKIQSNPGTLQLNCQDFLKIRMEWKINIIVSNTWRYGKQGDSWLEARFIDDAFLTSSTSVFAELIKEILQLKAMVHCRHDLTFTAYL